MSAVGHVYFLQINEHGPIKIGFSANDPLERMADLQVACPWPLRLLGSVAGTALNENYLHEKFDQHRMLGEWFEPAADVLAGVQEALSPGFAWPTKEITALDRAIAFAGSQIDLSNAIGCSQPLISRARKVGRVGPEIAIAIHHFTKGEVPASDLRPDLWNFPHQVPGAPKPEIVA